MDRVEGKKNYQLLAVGIAFIVVMVVMVGIGLLLLLLTHRTDLMVVGALVAIGGVLGPGVLGLLMIRSGSRDDWRKTHSTESRLVRASSITGPTVTSQRQMALIMATIAPVGAVMGSATQFGMVQPLSMGRALPVYAGGILLGLVTSALVVVVFRDPDGRVFSIKSMERLPPPESGRRKMLRLIGILLPIIPLAVLYQLTPDSQMLGAGWFTGYSFVIGGLLWGSYLRQRRRAA